MLRRRRSHHSVPRRFTGEPLAICSELPVPGFPSARVELYLARGAERPAVQVSCAGTLVVDDIGELHALDLDDAPWRLCGLGGFGRAADRKEVVQRGAVRGRVGKIADLRGTWSSRA